MDLQGVIFRRSIRSSYATVDLEVSSPEKGAVQSQRHVIVLVQFSNSNKSEATQCRSYFRREFKLGDVVEIIGGRWLDETGGSAPAHQKIEVVGFATPSKSPAPSPKDINIRPVRKHVWDNIRCQNVRALYYPPSTKSNAYDAKAKQTKRRKRGDNVNNKYGANNTDSRGDIRESENKTLRHGGGVGKRKQGDILASFLIERIALAKCNGSRDEAIAYLNSGTGCIDAAGGSGHVSLALSLQGIKSTVVDPRPNVGRLPKRDRKALRLAVKRHKARTGAGEGKQGEECTVATQRNVDGEQNDASISHPPLEFSTFRAWFGARPDGVDSLYREGTRTQNDSSKNGEYTVDASVPICHMCSSDKLLPNCSAIIALHPDEATGLIVEHAVKHRIPFVVVPCCVFSRIFSSRYKPNGELVQTYDDLLEWLSSKDPSIRVETLPFDGANRIVFSTF